MAKLFMNKNNSKSSQTPAPNSIGASRQTLKNQYGTLEGLVGTIGGVKRSQSKNESESKRRDH
jgi:hypothetical protein